MRSILKGREERVKKRREFIEAHSADSYICFTINMPGSSKNNEFTNQLFNEGIRCIKEGLHSSDVNWLVDRKIKNQAGPFYLIAAEASPVGIKRLAIRIEEDHIMGRFFDIDIYDQADDAVSRSDLDLSPRKCLVCNNYAKKCIREKSHTFLEIKDKIENSKQEFREEYDLFVDIISKEIEKIAYQAVLNEIFTTPKPGLVDKLNNGSHDDMDIDTFINSSKSIKKYFKEFFLCGFNIGNEINFNYLSPLRQIGKKAEYDMFTTTEGVNTQKGIIFSFGLIIAALGCLFNNGEIYSNQSISRKISAKVAEWTAGIVQSELKIKKRKVVNGIRTFKDTNNLTHGQEMYLKYGISGARGEAESGFVKAINHGLPTLRYAIEKGFDLNTASVQSLLSLISNVDDTNILYRSNLNTLKKVKKEADMILKKGGFITKSGKDRYYKFIDFMTDKDLSPGGSADLLAVTHLLYQIDDNFLEFIADKNSLLPKTMGVNG